MIGGLGQVKIQRGLGQAPAGHGGVGHPFYFGLVVALVESFGADIPGKARARGGTHLPASLLEARRHTMGAGRVTVGGVGHRLVQAVENSLTTRKRAGIRLTRGDRGATFQAFQPLDKPI